MSEHQVAGLTNRVSSNKGMGLTVKTMRNLVVLIALTVGLSGAVLGQAEWSPSEADTSQSEQVVRDFIRALGDSRLEEAYEMLTPGMQELMPFDRWRQSEIEFRKTSGGSARYRNVTATWYKDPPGASLPGVYVAFDLDCQYQNISRCHEILMLHQQSDGSFRVMRHDRTYAADDPASIRDAEQAEPQQ